MRTSACLTHGRYIFLTDDSGIGNPHAEPHIPGYVVTTLANTFVRVVSSELSGVRVEPSEDDIIRLVGRLENGVVPPREDPGSEDHQDESDQGEAPEDGTNETSDEGDDGEGTNETVEDEDDGEGTNETVDDEDDGEGTNETAEDEDDEVMGDGTGDGSSGDGSGGESTGDDGIRRSSPYSGSDDSATFKYSESGGTSDLYAGDSGGERAYACGPPAGDGGDDSESGFEDSSLGAPGFGFLIATTALAVGVLVRKRRKRS